MRLARPLPLLALAVVSMTACVNPRSEAAVAQALNDAANEISGLKNDMAQLQTQIDSLHEIVMKQDSTIARIAAVNNIPISR
jgi:peptidoglycan hydrolase CwlO-like protein